MLQSARMVVRWSSVAVVASVFLCVVAGYSWASVAKLPNTVHQSVVICWLQHDVRMDYTIGLMSSTLHPDGAQIKAGQGAIPMKLFSTASMILTDQITYSGVELLGGEYWVEIVVKAGELWSKTYAVLHKQKIVTEQAMIEAGFELPLSRIIDDISKIGNEIGMGSPTGKYEVDVRFHISVETQASEVKTQEYDPAFSFVVANAGLMLEPPQGKNSLTERFAEEVQVERVNTRFFRGQERSVADIKQGTLGIFALACMSLAGTLAWSINSWKSVRRDQAHPRLDPCRAYRDRLVKVTGLGAVQAGLIIRVEGLKELARIADETQAGIMELDVKATHYPPEFDSEATPELQGRRFFVVVGSAVYYVV